MLDPLSANRAQAQFYRLQYDLQLQLLVDWLGPQRGAVVNWLQAAPYTMHIVVLVGRE